MGDRCDRNIGHPFLLIILRKESLTKSMTAATDLPLRADSDHVRSALCRGVSCLGSRNPCVQGSIPPEARHV